METFIGTVKQELTDPKLEFPWFEI